MLTDYEIIKKSYELIREMVANTIIVGKEGETLEQHLIRLARWAYEKGKKDGRLDGITPSLLEEAYAKGKEEGIDAVEKELENEDNFVKEWHDDNDSIIWGCDFEETCKKALAAARNAARRTAVSKSADLNKVKE